MKHLILSSLLVVSLYLPCQSPSPFPVDDPYTTGCSGQTQFKVADYPDAMTCNNVLKQGQQSINMRVKADHLNPAQVTVWQGAVCQ